MEADTFAQVADERQQTGRQVLYERVAQFGATALSLAILWLAFSRIAREARLRRAAEAESRKNEDSLSTMLHSIGDGVIATDITGRVTRMNRVAERLTGWTMTEALGRPFADIFKMVDATTGATIDDPVALVLRDGKTVILGDNCTLLSRSGERMPVADSAAPIRDSTDRVVGAVIVFRDASAERHFTAKLRELNDDLERRVVERTNALRKTEEQLRHSQKIEAIGRLAGGISHDFNNLLTVVLSCTELLLDDAEREKFSPTVVSDLDEIRKAGQRAADLTRQLLAFSRQQVLSPKILDLNDIVSGMEKLLRRVIGADITLRTVKSTESAKVKVDPGQMEQVLMNLVVNARDAMPRGGKLTVEVSCTRLDAGDRKSVV